MSLPTIPSYAKIRHKVLWDKDSIDLDWGCIALDAQGNILHIVDTTTAAPFNTHGLSMTPSQPYDYVFKPPEEYEGLHISFGKIPADVDALIFLIALHSGVRSPETSLSESGNPRLSTERWNEEGGEFDAASIEHLNSASSGLIVRCYFRNTWEQWTIFTPLEGVNGVKSITDMFQAAQRIHAASRHQGEVPEDFEPQPVPTKFVIPTKARITINCAKNVRGMDKGGLSSDPYCLVTRGNEKIFKTRTQKKTLNPVWEESFEVEVQKSRKLVFTLFDKDLIFDDRIGTVRWKLPVFTLTEEPQEFVLPLEEKGFEWKAGDLVVSLCSLSIPFSLKC